MAPRKKTTKNDETTQEVEIVESKMNKKAEETVNEAPVKQEAEEKQETIVAVKAKHGISVVIPYLKRAAQGEELKLALRGWAEHFAEEFHIVVIGDKEDWFSDEIECIPVEQVSDNPQVNVMELIKIAVASEKVTPFFIWTNDDIYPFNMFTTVHIAVPKILGMLDPTNYNGHYAQNIKNTIKILGEGNLNYGTHTPIYLEKELIVEMLEKHPEVAKGDVLFSSCYFGFNPMGLPQKLNWKTDNWLLPIVSKNPDRNKLEEFAQHKCWLNNTTSGYSEVLEKFLFETFPKKSPFEKE